MPELVGFRAQVDTANIRTQTYKGAEYTVVPVIAMVEGVRFGANQTSGELGLTSEFGKFLASWNNRPCTTGHPKNNEGVFISANDLQTLNSWSFGMTANASLEGDKLKMEAWLNNADAESIPAAQQVIDRIQAGEIVEVSVGFFCDVEEKPGKFKGQSYTGVWRGIVPDHLAFLETGTLGACSVEDGCGAPRINMRAQSEMDTMAANTDTISSNDANVTSLSANPTATPAQAAAPAPASAPNPSKLQVAVKALQNSVAQIISFSASNDGLQVDESKDCGCGCGGTCGQPSIQERKAYGPWDHFNRILCQNLKVQKLSSQLLTRDVIKALNSALLEEEDVAPYDLYVFGYTSEKVVYEVWKAGAGFKEFQRSFDIDDNATVTFTGQAEEITIVSRIVAKGTLTTQETDMSDSTNLFLLMKDIPDPAKLTEQQKKDLGPTALAQLEEAYKAQQAKITPQSAQPSQQPSQQPGTGASTPNTPTTLSAPAAIDGALTVGDGTPKVLTTEEYLKTAPEGIREVIASGLRMHDARKNFLVVELLKVQEKDSGFDEAYLKGQPLEVLEKMAKLAKIGVQEPKTVSYLGLPTAQNPQVPTVQYAEIPTADRWASPGSRSKPDAAKAA